MPILFSGHFPSGPATIEIWSDGSFESVGDISFAEIERALTPAQRTLVAEIDEQLREALQQTGVDRLLDERRRITHL